MKSGKRHSSCGDLCRETMPLQKLHPTSQDSQPHFARYRDHSAECCIDASMNALAEHAYGIQELHQVTCRLTEESPIRWRLGRPPIALCAQCDSVSLRRVPQDPKGQTLRARGRDPTRCFCNRRRTRAVQQAAGDSVSAAGCASHRHEEPAYAF